VGPDRFDDVEYRVLEEPEPPRRPRLRQWTFAALSVVVATGVLAGGASAITGEDAAPSAKTSQKGGADSSSPRDRRDCDKPHHRRNSELKY
jgi:hypothetical protein